MIKNTVLITIFILLLTACNSNKYKPEIQQRNGLKTVTNKNYPVEELQYEIEMELTDENSKYVFNSISDFAEDNAGNIYMMDAGDCNIKKFDKDGDFIKVFSRKGSGPGEIGSAGHLIATSDGKIITFDAQRMTFIIFDFDGNLVTSQKADAFFPMDFTINDNDMILAVGLTLGDGGLGKSPELVRIYDKNLSYVKSFVDAEVIANPQDSYLKNMLALTYKKNKLYLNYIGTDKITIYNDTIPQLNIIRETFSKSKSELTDNNEKQMLRLQPNSNGIAVDNAGNIYTITHGNIESDEVSYIQRFNPEGVQTGCFTIPDITVKTYTFTEDDRMLIFDDNGPRVIKIRILN